MWFFSKTIKVKIHQGDIAKGLPLPSYGRKGDAGLDIAGAEDIVIPPHCGRDLHTGIFIAPPWPFWFRVVAKGSSARRGIGFDLEDIDWGYTGEIILHPWNKSPIEVVVPRGKCIAQIVPVPYSRVQWIAIGFDSLPKTERGDGRMDSTKTGIA